MSKVALITGITGQDGSYLAELLLSKNYEVHGLVRHSSTESFRRIEHLRDQISIETAELLDQGSLTALVDKVQMCVDLHHVDVAAALEGIDAGNIDGVVTAEHDGQRSGVENGADPGLDIGVALDGIGVHDIGPNHALTGQSTPSKFIC